MSTTSPAGGGLQGRGDARPAEAIGEAAVPRRVRTAMFVVGVALPQAGLTFATMLALYLYDWIGVPLR